MLILYFNGGVRFVKVYYFLVRLGNLNLAFKFQEKMALAVQRIILHNHNIRSLSKIVRRLSSTHFIKLHLHLNTLSLCYAL